jgi:hypothetical protein
MEINWTVVTYLVIGLFALSGFFRGWWKEGILTLFLVILLALLQIPEVAEAVIGFVNSIVEVIWGIRPDLFSSIFETLFGVSTANNAAVQLNPGEAGTWLLILVVMLVIAILLGNLLVPARGVTVIGSVLGGLLGAFNGFLAVSLVREYLDGRALPGLRTSLPVELQLQGGAVAGRAAPGFTIQATELPRFTILDSILPWILIGVGILIFVAVIRTGFGFRGFGFNRRVPPGYR